MTTACQGCELIQSCTGHQYNNYLHRKMLKKKKNRPQVQYILVSDSLNKPLSKMKLYRHTTGCQSRIQVKSNLNPLVELLRSTHVNTPSELKARPKKNPKTHELTIVSLHKSTIFHPRKKNKSAYYSFWCLLTR